MVVLFSGFEIGVFDAFLEDALCALEVGGFFAVGPIEESEAVREQEVEVGGGVGIAVSATDQIKEAGLSPAFGPEPLGGLADRGEDAGILEPVMGSEQAFVEQSCHKRRAAKGVLVGTFGRIVIIQPMNPASVWPFGLCGEDLGKDFFGAIGVFGFAAESAIHQEAEKGESSAAFGPKASVCFFVMIPVDRVERVEVFGHHLGDLEGFGITREQVIQFHRP